MLALALLSLGSAALWPSPPLVTADGQVWRAPTSAETVRLGPVSSLPGVPPEFPRPPVSVREAEAPRRSVAPVAPEVRASAPEPDSAAVAGDGQGDGIDAAPAAWTGARPGGEDVGGADAPTVERRIEARREQPWLGAQLDVGFPDGVGASLMVMPAEWLRLQVGGSWNGASRGLRAALVALLFPSFFKSVRPTLSLEGGYAFDTDSRWLVDRLEDPALKAALSRVTVLHGGGLVGLEFGSKYFSFFLRAGVSYVDVQLGEYAGQSAAVRGLSLHGLFPSGKLGFLVCFL